jgi:multidrug efflux system membrane fusion protein
MDEYQHTTALETPAPAHPSEAPLAPAPAPPPPPRRSRALWVWLLILAVAAAAVYFYWSNNKASKSATATSGAADKKGGRGALPPVVAVKATRGNIGVYYTGLGAVTPIYTVTLKSRVDGELMSVHYKEGDIVHKGDLLIEIDPRPYQVALTQAEGTLLKDQANLDNARLDLKRYETLLKQNAVPEQQLATQKATVAQDEGIVKTDQGVIDAAKLNLVYSKITSPIDGRVGLRLVDPGNIVHAADTNGLLVITQIQPISVIFTIAEDQLPAVLQRYRAGQRLEVDAFQRDGKTKIAQGYLSTIDNEIDQSTGTLKLRAQYNNSGYELFPNQFVNARLLVQEKTGVVLLPTTAIQRNTNSTYVYLIRPDSTVTVRNIVVGTTEGDQSEITSGLNPGDQVVMTGVDKLTEGAKVRISKGGAGAKGQGGAAPAGVGGAQPADSSQGNQRGPGSQQGANAPAGQHHRTGSTSKAKESQ